MIFLILALSLSSSTNSMELKYPIGFKKILPDEELESHEFPLERPKYYAGIDTFGLVSALLGQDWVSPAEKHRREGIARMQSGNWNRK